MARSGELDGTQDKWGGAPGPDAADQPIPHLLAQSIARHALRIAIRDPQRALTYAELGGAVDRVAAAVRRALPGPLPAAPQAVGILFDVRAAGLIALLGVLQAGHFFTSLDSALPEEMLQRILEDARVSLILTDTAHLDRAHALAGDRRAVIDVDALDALPATDCLPAQVTADHLAALFYTSGSTGAPKGVVHTHRSLLGDILFRVERLALNPADRVACFNPFSVSASLWKTLGTLLAGGCACLYDLRWDGLSGVAGWMHSQRITVLSTLSAIRHLLTYHPDEQFPAVRLVQAAGDTIYPRDIQASRRSFSHATFSTGLALSETGAVTSWLLRPDQAFTEVQVPLGYATGEKQVLILAEDGQRLGPGEAGEIAIQSRRLAPGYWRNPELTRQRFLPDPAGGGRIYLTGDLGTLADDGCLYHLGRKDFQVKIRNQRVQLPAVEAALQGIADVQEAVVVAHPSADGEPRLVAYLVTHTPAPTVSQLHRNLSAVLPEYMVPKAFVFLDCLPRTRTDKVDRRRLPLPSPVRPELDTPYVAPRTPLERTLAALWADVLGLDRVGVHDDFLELGGHSLAAGRIIARAEAALSQPLPLQHLFAARSVAQMALAITHRHLSALDSAAVEAALAGLE
jgi:amino acid adenylation domain-containing protein